MDRCFELEVLPDEHDFEADAVVDNTFEVGTDDDIFRPGETRDIIRDRRQ